LGGWGGWFTFQTKVADDYIDMSEWESISLDVRCPNIGMESFKLNLAYTYPTYSQTLIHAFEPWPNLSATNDWQTLNFNSRMQE
jgi:hypothetical protein